MNIIRFSRNDRIGIQIAFGFPIMAKYKHHSASQKWSNTKYANKNFVKLPKRKAFKDLFRGSQGDTKFAESSDDQS